MHVFVTGASAGLGEAMARRFADGGGELTLVARREGRLRELAESLDTRCFVRPADLSDISGLSEIVAEAEAELGPIDVLINNAGIQYVEPAVGVGLERIQKLMKVNVVAPLGLIDAVLPGMLERRRGTIINISSMAAITPSPWMSHYSGSKAAIAATSESLGAEIRGSGVRVITVYPGPVESEMETAAREKFPSTPLVTMLPTGTAEGLAKSVFRAFEKGKSRVVYPRTYALARYFRPFSEWITRRFTPSLLLENEKKDAES